MRSSGDVIQLVLPHERNIPKVNIVLAKINFATIALVAVLAASPLAAQQTGPEIANFTLANGLEFVVIPDHRAPVVTHMIWYKVGAADETPGKSGLAHFLEHLMFKGTAKNPAGKFSQVVARIGGQENAFTAQDYTGYYQRVPSDQLKTVMEFEADRMTGLQLTDDVVLPERNVILEEQNQRIGNNPRARLGEQIDAALYLNSPYGKPVIGWRHEMEQLSRDDAIGFYRRFYAPNNAVVVIAGDVDPAQARALAEETYGKVPQHGAMAPRARPQEPPPVAVRSLTLADARVEMPALQREYLTPSFATGKRGESEALEVLAHILGNGSNSRLYRSLAVDKQVAVSADAWYDSGALDMSKFTVSGSPRPGVTLPQLESEIDAVIAQIIDKGVTSEELERTKTRLIADAVYAQDNQASMARWYGAALTTGGSVNDVRHWPDRIRAVTADQVRDAARQWLDKRRSVTGYLIKDVSPQAEKRS
ncbi:MAG: pitrilysin family protein [Pseudolabrys sp.]